MKISISYFLSLAIITLFCRETVAQLDNIWKDYGEDCSKHGINIGFPPGLTDYWFINVPCKNYKGSVGCITPSPEAVGKCECNLGEGAYFDQTMQICLGKVGAFCTAEKTSLVPEKLCTPNADCIPIQSEGHTVGSCQCRYGFKAAANGQCIVDEEVPEEERSTPRTTTAAPAPDRGSIKLPINLLLKVLLGGNTTPYDQKCDKGSLFPLLNRTACNTHQSTVACINKKCGCNMGDEDSIYDGDLDLCVGRVGTYCLARKYLLGFKSCVSGADCFLENVEDSIDDYSFGTCQCLYGWDEQSDGTCLRNPDITDPSTKNPGGPIPTTQTTTQTTSTEGGAAQLYLAYPSMVLIFSTIYLMYVIRAI